MATEQQLTDKPKRYEVPGVQQTGSGTHSSRISGVAGVLMVIIALLIDGLQAFLSLIVIGIVVNLIIDVFVWLVFYIWLKSLGISMSEAKGLRTLFFLGLAFGFEFVPLLNVLPGWTAFAIGAILNERASVALDKVPVVNKFV